jgi:hypothetical protein
MNRFDTDFTGGLPYYNDDFTFITSYLKDFIDNLLARYEIGSNENFIISGCIPSITPGFGCTVTDGYIHLNGEVLKVDGQNLASTAGDTYVFVKSTTTDSAGDRTIKNTGTTANCYEINRGVLLNVSSVAANQLSVLGDSLQDKIEASFSDANETTRGILEVATTAEANALTADDKIITPVKLPESSTTQKGLVELATDAETQNDATTDKAITPSGLATRLATEILAGILEVATTAEANALTADDKIITPAKIPIASSTQKGITEYSTDAEAQAGTSTTLAITPANLAAVNGGGLLTKVIEIGDWNMWVSGGSGISAKVVAHGLTVTDIRSFTVILRIDGEPFTFVRWQCPVSYLAGGGATPGAVQADAYLSGGSNVEITHAGVGSLFDNTNYKDTGYNRGWVVIQYVP